MNEVTKPMAEALAKFHAQDIKVDLNGKVKFGNTEFKYATLGEIYEKVKPALQEAGLTYTHWADHEKNTINTVLICVADGSTITSSIPVNFQGKPKEVGATITYFKRYPFASILGIATEEDNDADIEVSKPSPTEAQWQQVLDKAIGGEEHILEKAMAAFSLNGDQIRKLVHAEDIAEDATNG